ncbi:GIN domain-containing protein [Plantactinospora sp. GCM10030261]|uniref:GIN domain-containing protein n=1 Tax=Plantactinospora sp. GCM10030261 TaxID=3273420 RepID=UPI003617E17F
MSCRRLVAAVLATLTGIGLSGCALVLPAGDPVTQTRDIPDVTAVVLKTTGDLVVSVGPPRLEVTAGDKVIDSLTSRVDGDTLELGKTRGSTLRGDWSYRLTVSSLASVTIDGSGKARVDFSGSSNVAIAIDGSGKVTADKIDAAALTVDLTGTSTVTAIGRATRQTVTLEAGGYSAYDLSSDEATVTVDGSGDAKVRVSRTLDARIDGSGSITHLGDAKVTSKVDGSGKVSAG